MLFVYQREHDWVNFGEGKGMHIYGMVTFVGSGLPTISERGLC